MRKYVWGAVVGVVLVTLATLPAWVSMPSTPRRLTGITEVYFTSPYLCTVYTIDPTSREYKVETIQGIGGIRVFLDRTNATEEVTWNDRWVGCSDVEVHVADMKKVRGNLEGR